METPNWILRYKNLWESTDLTKSTCLRDESTCLQRHMSSNRISPVVTPEKKQKNDKKTHAKDNLG